MESSRPQQRPRSKSAFSFKSDKSHSSKTSGKHKEHINLKETHAEKARTHLTATTKANPNAAMNEAQPIAAQLEASTLGSLRAIRPTDIYGNPIDEPDISNPTRPRWERPLDTIRSFEAAIDGEYKRRSTMVRTESAPDFGNGYTSRRSSYYGGYDNYNSRRSQVGGGYYGSRQSMARDDDTSFAPPAGPSRSRYSQRLQSEGGVPQYRPQRNGDNIYPSNGYHQSRDTVNTGGSNGSQSEPYGNSTDPSSENSSIERRTPSSKHDLGEQYGFSGFQNSIAEEHDFNNGLNYSQFSNYPPANPNPNGFPSSGYSNGNYGAQAPPGPVAAPNRVPIKLGADTSQPIRESRNVGVAQSKPSLQSQPSIKRKSWFKRRFSKD